MILEKAIKQASKILKSYNIHSHELDAQLILSQIMKVERELLITNSEITVSEKIIKKYEDAIKRRTKKEPVAYINGKKEFWSKDFIVNQSTLVPRPETELLIYKLISHFKNKKIRILDIGTGSGCILISILKELKLSSGVGIDISPKAIHTAKINSKNHNLENRSKFKACDITIHLIRNGAREVEKCSKQTVFAKYDHLKKLFGHFCALNPMVSEDTLRSPLNQI